MATNAIASRPTPAPTFPSKHYLNASYGIGLWLLTTDHKRIRLLYIVPSHSSSCWALSCFHNSAQFDDASVHPGFSRDLQPAFYNAWRRDDPLFSGSVDSCGPRQFPDSSLIGAKDLAFPRLNLLSWYPATGLEWQTPSPPPEENFHVTPQVTWGPHDFLNRPDLGLETAGVPALAPAHGDD
jgi:hypothetical protein